MVHETGNEKEHAIVKELRDNGIQTYSISRLNTFNQCKAEYFQTYVKRNKGESNVYSEIGSFIHDYIENTYRGEIEDTSDFSRKLNTRMFKLEIGDIKFPNEKIENAFRGDMEHFCNNFKKLDGSFELEKMYVAKFGEHYLMGYIDAIREKEDSKIDIIDWKTSSKFTGDKLTHAGRQLIIYKLGLEQKGYKIDKVMWNMLKYCYVCWKQKNGKVKQKMVNRSKIIKDMRKNFEKTLLNNGMNELKVESLLDEAEKNNDFDMLPQCIKDEFWIEECLLEYEVTDERVDEVEQYIKDTIKKIESMDFEDESQWKPLNIDKDNFYCNTLCNHRSSCKHLKEWKSKNPFKKIGF